MQRVVEPNDTQAALVAKPAASATVLSGLALNADSVLRFNAVSVLAAQA